MRPTPPLALFSLALATTFAARAQAGPAHDEDVAGIDLPRTELTMPDNHGGIFAYAISPDGKQIAGATGIVTVSSEGRPESRRGGEIVLWDPKTGKLKKTLGSHEETPTFLEFSARGKTLVSASHEDAVVKVWKSSGGKARATIPLTGSWRYGDDPALAPSGERLAYVVQDELEIGDREIDVQGALEVWDLKKKAAVWTRPESFVETCSISPDGRHLAVFVDEVHWRMKDGKVRGERGDRRVELLELETGELVWSAEPPRSEIKHLAFLGDGSELIGATGKQLHRWAVGDGSKLGEASLFDEHQSLAYLIVAEDDRRVAVGEFMGEATHVFDIESGERRMTLSFEWPKKLSHPVLSPDFRVIVGTLEFKPVRIELPDSGR